MNIIIGLGGNLGDIRAAFRAAVAALGERNGLTILGGSSLYRTLPIGPDQPSFLNSAIMIEVEFSARELLRLCHKVETATGRDRAKEDRWGPRTLDLDLLIADTLVCRGPVLEVPHPRLNERAFALVPAAELAPMWVHPTDGRTLVDLADRVAAGNPKVVERIGEW